MTQEARRNSLIGVVECFHSPARQDWYAPLTSPTQKSLVFRSPSQSCLAQRTNSTGTAAQALNTSAGDEEAAQFEETYVPLTPLDNQMLIPLVNRSEEMKSLELHNQEFFKTIANSLRPEGYARCQSLWAQTREEMSDRQWIEQNKMLLGSFFRAWAHIVGFDPDEFDESLEEYEDEDDNSSSGFAGIPEEEFDHLHDE